jgi:hypothetical protein
MMQVDLGKHSTSSMHAPPSGTEPENAVAHGAGTLERVQGFSLQSALESASRQVVAAVASNVALPLDTAVSAAVAVLKSSREMAGPTDTLHVDPSGNCPQRIARVQSAVMRSVTQVTVLVGLLPRLSGEPTKHAPPMHRRSDPAVAQSASFEQASLHSAMPVASSQASETDDDVGVRHAAFEPRLPQSLPPQGRVHVSHRHESPWSQSVSTLHGCSQRVLPS